MSVSGGSSGSAFGLPSYAHGAAGYWTPDTSEFGGNAVNLRKFRAQLEKAVAGTGILDIVVLCDSAGCGFNGTVFDSPNSWPRKMRDRLASLAGAATIGGIVPATGQQDRYVLTGAASILTNPDFITFNGAGTATFVTEACTTISAIFSNLNTSNLTWTVDAVAQPAMVPNATATLGKITSGGFANVAHTVVITSAGAGNFYMATDQAGAASGIRLHNLGLGGTRASIGNATQNWSDHSASTALAETRKAMMTLMGYVPQLGIIQIGSNDLVQGATIPAIMAGIADMKTQYAVGGWLFADGWNVPPVTAVQYEAFLTALYAQTASDSTKLYDWYDRVGGIATAIANGQIGADNIHPTSAAQAGFGNSVANGLVN